MAAMVIEIEIGGMAVLFDLLVNVEAGASSRVPGGAILGLPKLPSLQAASGTPTRLRMNLQCGLGTDAETTGSWLYEKLKGKVRKLWIDQVVVPIDRTAIIKIIRAKKSR